MRCCSRSTLGIVIGVLNILTYIGITIFAIHLLVKNDQVEPKSYEHKNDLGKFRTILIVVIVVCLAMTVISGLLIMGIVKRLHKLMIPYLVLSGIGFICNCAHFVFNFFGALFSGVPFPYILLILIVGILSFAISGLILWAIFKLYGDIRKENIERPRNVMAGVDLHYKMQDNY